MNAKNIFEELSAWGEANRNQERVEKYLRYFKEGYDAFGLEKGLAEEKVKELLAREGMSQKIALELSLLLVKSPKYEFTVMAILLVRKYYISWTIETFRTVEKWFSLGITNWAETDYICGELLNLLYKKGIITLDTVAGWRTAENKFQRRAAVVGLIKPMKLSKDFQPWFDFIDPMMMDPAREVHQGLGWFLREAWKKQPQPTEEFLMRWRNTAPRLIFQYATEKMTPDNKLRFRRNK
jgi:3-methyladenine DNA glycosylase AlkD